MTVIPIPKKPRAAFNPNRPVSSLLKTQVLHLREVEKLFPPAYRPEIYINTIKTEGEAAEYIRSVTQALHRLHREGAGERVGPIAASAERKPARKTRQKSKPKPKSKKLSKTGKKKKRS
ncbi:MAG: hypothetical protein DMG73_09685 [Acidobacteria bacterium]|nr:MAG: hypothetical protein DMG73_09685 [Acidobacteriota bacterium]PYX63645.1 MAG: hypothetical protein DMG74_16330 [Acidobacteriota bacterium]